MSVIVQGGPDTNYTYRDALGYILVAHTTKYIINSVFFCPRGAFSLRDLKTGPVAAGLGRRVIVLGARPSGLALAQDPWPTRRARKNEKTESILRGTPSHSAEPS